MRWRSRSIAAAVAVAVAVVTTSSVRPADLPPIKIGIVYSYTGTPEYIGRGFDAGLQAFIAEHGDMVAGRKIVLIKRDDNLQPETARRVAQELIVQENVDYLAGVGVTPNAIAVAQVSTQAKKPFFIANAATSGILAANPYTVRLGFTTKQTTVPLAQWALANKVRTVYAVFQDYGPGIDAGAQFAKTFTAGGGKVVGESRVPATALDDAAYVQRVKDAKVDAAFTFFNLTGATVFLKAASAGGLVGSGAKILSADLLVDENDLLSGDESLIGLISSGNYLSTLDSSLNRRFMHDFAVAYGSPRLPGFNEVAAYDTMSAIYRVIAAQKGATDPDKTMELLKGMTFESPRGRIVIDAQTRDIVQNVYIGRIEKRNGRLKVVPIATIPMVKDPSE